MSEDIVTRLAREAGAMSRHIKELGYTVVAEPGDCIVDFTFYEILCEDESGAPNWRRQGADGGFDPV